MDALKGSIGNDIICKCKNGLCYGNHIIDVNDVNIAAKTLKHFFYYYYFLFQGCILKWKYIKRHDKIHNKS